MFWRFQTCAARAPGHSDLQALGHSDIRTSAGPFARRFFEVCTLGPLDPWTPGQPDARNPGIWTLGHLDVRTHTSGPWSVRHPEHRPLGSPGISIAALVVHIADGNGRSDTWTFQFGPLDRFLNRCTPGHSDGRALGCSALVTPGSQCMG